MQQIQKQQNNVYKIIQHKKRQQLNNLCLPLVIRYVFNFSSFPNANDMYKCCSTYMND